MLKMKEVYEQNPALGDPNSLHKKIEQNSDKLNSLQSEMKKFQVHSKLLSCRIVQEMSEKKTDLL